jgi:pimeloyl-ACP methyl ester carboxylesterase
MESRDVGVSGATLRCLVDGSADGPLALLVHGFPDGATSFRHQVAPLCDRGYRVVRPYTRGYAPSSLARDGRYDLERLSDDLLGLGAHFSPSRPFVLVGHDWGAMAAYAAAARAPERIARLCTVAVPHLRVAGPRFLAPRQLAKSWYVALFQLRLYAEARVRAHDFRFIDELWRAWSPGHHEDLTDVIACFRAPEHLRAVLGYYRAILSPRNHWVRRRTRVPALYVHGEDDGCVGIELCRDLEAAYTNGIQVERVGGAGHFVHLERPDEFNRVLLDFLSRDI